MEWPIHIYLMPGIPYSGNFRGRKFRGFVAIHERFSVKFGDVASFGNTSEQFMKVFSTKVVFSTNLPPLKVSLYN